MKATFPAVVVEGRVEFVRPMDPPPIDYPHNRLLGFPERRHHWVEILAQLLRIKVWDDFIADFGGTVLPRPQDTEQHTVGDPAPGARAAPRLAFARFVPFALPLAHRACGQPRTRRCPPPARPGQGKAPQDGFIFIKQNDLALASLVLAGRQCDRRRGEGRRCGIKTTGGAVVTYPFFLRHNGHFRDRAGRQFGRRTRSRVRGNSIASRPSHAQEGLARPDD